MKRVVLKIRRRVLNNSNKMNKLDILDSLRANKHLLSDMMNK